MTSALTLLKKAERLAMANSPSILTALGVSGTITTAYLTAKAAYDSAYVMVNIRENRDRPKERKAQIREYFAETWELYIPPVLAGSVTIACIVSANRVGNRRAAAITAAYSLSEKAFTEYRDKVVETFGETKEQKVRDQLAQDKVTNNPPKQMEIAFTGGQVLFLEAFTGRYFISDMEKIRKAQNEVNSIMLKHDYATLSDLYHLIGLANTTFSSGIGWQSDKLLDLYFSTAMSPDDRPCIVIEYNYTTKL
jgi:hypothetical protein